MHCNWLSLTPMIPISVVDDGVLLGADDGALLGALDGALLGTDDGAVLGADDGALLGTLLGTDDGAVLGADVGSHRVTHSPGVHPTKGTHTSPVQNSEQLRRFGR